MNESNISAKAIGQRITTVRGKHNESQQVLADYLGKKREQVTYWESGKRLINLSALVQIAQHYNVSVDYLLGLTKTESDSQSVRDAVFTTGLSEEAIDILCGYVIDADYEAASKQIDKPLTAIINRISLDMLSTLITSPDFQQFLFKTFRLSLSLEHLTSILEDLSEKPLSSWGGLNEFNSFCDTEEDAELRLFKACQAFERMIKQQFNYEEIMHSVEMSGKAWNKELLKREGE